MYTKAECVERLNRAIPELKEKFGVETLCVFGSVARGENIEGSDVDVFVKMPPKAFKILALKDYLQNLLGTGVDVIREHSQLDSFLIQNIEDEGVAIC